jgi:hypothetical protein
MDLGFGSPESGIFVFAVSGFGHGKGNCWRARGISAHLDNRLVPQKRTVFTSSESFWVLFGAEIPSDTENQGKG